MSHTNYSGNKIKSSTDKTKAPVNTNKDLSNMLEKDEFKNNFKKWVTFFKLNYDIFATWYLGLDLFLYQKILLHFMGKSSLAVIIASRGISKSFCIAIYACCKAILEPNSIIVIASATRNQAMLILKEKIQNELCTMSPNLAKEIKAIKVSQNDGLIEFHNGSRILIVTASQNSRGYRSNCNIYEEARMIDEEVLNSVLSPFLISRQAPYLKNPKYAHLKTEPTEIYISSAWFKSLEWFWKLIKSTGQDMLNGGDGMLMGFDYKLAVHHGLKTEKQMIKEKEKSDEISFAIEYENQMFDSAGSFFSYDLLKDSRKVKKVLYPLFPEEIAGKKKVARLNKKKDVIRILSCDIAMSGGNANDNSIYTLCEMIPMKSYYIRKIVYMESHNGKTAPEQSIRIRRLIHEFDVDVCVLDCMNIGLPVLDLLGTQLVDDETGEEYAPICAYNDDELRDRCKSKNARAMIFGMRASLQLNSNMVVEMKNLFQQSKVEMLLPEPDADKFLTATNKQYGEGTMDSATKGLYDAPYVQISLAINECIQLETDLKQGKITVREKGASRKDRFSSLLYLLWVSSLIETENMSEEDEDDDLSSYLGIGW